MNKIKISVLAFILSSFIFLTGCANIFIASDKVLTLSSELKSTASINSLLTEQPGRVCSITSSGHNLLSISKNNNTYTIDNYQVSDNSLVNVIYSETRIFDVQAAGEGFFYSRINPSDPGNIQISWSTYDKSVERTITDSLDNASVILYAYDNDKVVFINNGNSLVFSNSNGTKTKYDLSFQAEVSKLVWSNNQNVGFIIARKTGSDSFDLYQLDLEDELKVSPIATNVIDMDLNSESNELVYIIQSNHSTECYILENIKKIKNTRIFAEENLEKVSFSDDGQSLYLTKSVGNGVRSVIWYYDLETKKQYQVTSPMRIISSIFPLTVNNEVVYSVSQLTYLEASDIIQTNYYITHLNFSIPTS